MRHPVVPITCKALNFKITPFYEYLVTVHPGAFIQLSNIPQSYKAPDPNGICYCRI